MDDIERREASITWFDTTLLDANGDTIEMYSVVTPLVVVAQTYAENQHALLVLPGTRCIVVGAANGDTEQLWIEVDEPGASAHALITRSNLRRLPERVVEEQTP